MNTLNTNGLSKITKLQASPYTSKSYGLSSAVGSSNIGVIAQTMQSVFPGAVTAGYEAQQSTSYVKKYQVLEINEDLLGLSVTWHRLREQNKQGLPYVGVENLTDKNLFDSITDQDRELASNIRDYYSKKIMMWKLKGQHLTKFREDMNTFIHSDGKIFKEDMFPLVYRLPEFYFYDIGFDKLANEHNKIIKDSSPVFQTKTLNLHKTFLVGKRFCKRKEYWFTDNNDNLVTLSCTHDNPLLSLLDLTSKSPLTITARFNVRDRDNVQYMCADKYKFS